MLKISQFSPGEVAFVHRFFPTHCNLIHKSGTLRKRIRSDMTCNSRIAKIFLCQVGISIGKQPPDIGKTLRQHLFARPYLSNLSLTSRKSKILRKRVSQAFQGYQDRLNPTSRATSTVCMKTNKNKENVLEI